MYHYLRLIITKHEAGAVNSHHITINSTFKFRLKLKYPVLDIINITGSSTKANTLTTIMNFHVGDGSEM